MRLKYLLLILIVLLFSGLRIRLASRFSHNYLSGDRLRITERLTEQPYRSRSGQHFTLAGVHILARDFPPYNFGSLLQVEGILQSTKSDSSNYARGLPGFAEDDFWLIYPNIKVLSDVYDLQTPRISAGTKLWLLVARLRLGAVTFFEKVLPEPHASLLAGVVLGERAAMPDSFYAALRETGSLHIIAASGMNVTIIAGIVINVLILVVSRKVAVILALLGVALYALLAGMSPSIVRAGIMGVIAYSAVIFGRERDGLIALIGTALVMLLVQPGYLVDIGWQLSVSATAGIVLLREPVKRYISILFDRLMWMREVGGGRLELGSEKREVGSLNLEVRSGTWAMKKSRYLTSKPQNQVSHLSLLTSISEEMAVTLSAQTLTLPLILFHFGVFSYTSLVVNVLLAPVVPVLMIWGGLVAMVGMVWPWLGQVVAWGAWVFLEYFVRVVEAFSRWFGAVEVERVPGLFVLGYYLVITWVIWRLKDGTDNTSS